MKRILMGLGSLLFGYLGSGLAGVMGYSDWSPVSLMLGMIGGAVGILVGFWLARYLDESLLNE